MLITHNPMVNLELVEEQLQSYSMGTILGKDWCVASHSTSDDGIE
jgi:hypothetical protein